MFNIATLTPNMHGFMYTQLNKTTTVKINLSQRLIFNFKSMNISFPLIKKVDIQPKG